jgi:hypothetical protein
MAGKKMSRVASRPAVIARAAIAIAAALLLPAGAAAQGRPVSGPEQSCALPRDPDGVIRGDRVPTGCVIRSDGRERREPPGLVAGTVLVIPVLVPNVVAPGFLQLPPDPPFVGAPPGPGAVRDAGDLPRVRPGPFGPLFRPFGPHPVGGPVDPTGRPFGPVTQPFRPTNRAFDATPAPASQGGTRP